MDMIFVPDGKDRRETAVLLTGSADEFGIPQREVKAVNGGFMISQRLADAVEKDRKATKASGNRAAKNSSVKSKE